MDTEVEDGLEKLRAILGMDVRENEVICLQIGVAGVLVGYDAEGDIAIVTLKESGKTYTTSSDRLRPLKTDRPKVHVISHDESGNRVRTEVLGTLMNTELTADAQKAAAKMIGLRLFNGRGVSAKYRNGHLFIAARSNRDAADLLGAACGLPNQRMTGEIKKFYAKDCWGTTMAGVVPERGVWFAAHPNNPPTRIL